MGRLYHGETEIDFVGRFRLWATISAVVIVVGLISLVTRGLNLGIDFEGGIVWEVEANGTTVTDARDALDSLGLAGAEIQTLSSDEGVRLRIQAEPATDADESRRQQEEVADSLAELTGTDSNDVSINSVGPTWGEEISRKALRALIFFLIAITLYITFRFEFKMAMPTLVALVHDILVTIGVYSIAGFEVTPATVIAILTILGYSIYDGIVVFDKVDENSRLVSSAGRMTYSDMVNLSLNQVLMRSLNTSITALLPISSLLIVGSFLLGARTLQEFALALLIGLASGAYSSLFIASPLLAVLKARAPRSRDMRRRIEAREARTGAPAAAATAPVVSATPGGDTDGAGEPASDRPRVPAATAPRSANIPPRPRKKGKKR
ncbi:protein translocase subunit SecF [soil metagenome]